MKRALVLSGGASHGAWQAGSLKYLINDLGISYDILCGVSVGALNVGYLSLYPKEQEKEAFKNLEAIWNNIDDSKMKKNWFPLGPVHGLWLDSFYNSQPLIDLVHSTMDLAKVRASGRDVTVGAVSLKTGNYRTFTQKDDSFIDAILASSAFPMGLNPIMIDGEKYIDGGIKHVLPIKEAIDLGATDIDVIICAPIKTTAHFDDVDALTLGLRCLDFVSDQNIEADLKLAELYNQLVNLGAAPDKKYLKINVIRPTADLGVSSLTFTNADVKKMMEQGYLQANEQYKP